MNRVLCLTADDYYLRTGHPSAPGDDDITTFAPRSTRILLILDPLQKAFCPPTWRWPAATRCAARASPERA